MVANTEGGWVERLRVDSPDRETAIGELREILVRGLTRSLSTKYGSGLQAEDVVQDALLKILDSLDSFQGRSRFTTWAMTIATRVGISELRRRHYKNVSLDAITSGEERTLEIAVADESDPGAGLDRLKLVAKLKELVDSTLTEKQRIAIHASLEGLPVEEIARRTGSNRNAVYKLVHDARIRLRDGFTDAGISPEDVSSIISS